MLAVFINCGAVILGSLIGILVGKHVKDSFKEIVFSCSGLVTIVMGIQMALGSTNFLVMLIALLLGGALGYLLKIEDRIYSLGEKMGKATHSEGTQNFAKGFLTASVLFCSGAMSVVGSIQAGTTGEMTTILIKSVMDGCMAVVFASIYGIGVLFSFLFILLYQGFFTLAGGWLQPILGEVGIAELSAEGGVLLLMIGLGLLKIKEFKTANFIPALVFAPVLAILVSKIL
ncbi:MAG: DUF554 domain-containing protein [Spirochaetales bacterium]|nr:DUF554 domain-containing protein [Spirochaetales bacterium]MBQ7507874.1 DUF554 domain-containing protein [Spirochaetales bacterium]MBR6348143.1 DUF554 domain-containing protein [Spirochaetales bacterium]